MAKNENGSNGSKEKIEAFVPSELNDKTIDYASERGQWGIEWYESLEHHLDKCDTKSLIQDACDRGR